LARFIDVDSNIVENHCTTSGYTLIINSGTIFWSAKHQKIVTLLTTEFEYVNVTYIAKKAIWLHSLIL